MEQDHNDKMRPVAYGADGKPLYASPEIAKAAVQKEQPAGAASTPLTQQSHQPHQFVHVARAVDPAEVDVPVEVQHRHTASIKKFPDLNLSPHEYVVVSVPRHFIGILIPAIITSLCVALALTIVINYPFIAATIGLPMSSFGSVVLIGVLLTVLFLIGGYAALWVYLSNRFFLTNESVIQEIQTGLFTHKEQTVSLANIEDASYNQTGPVQTILNYGSIRLSTEGDETTYRYDYVSNPKYYISILNNAVEAFKNGRPVGFSVEDGIKDKGTQAKAGSSAGKKDDPNDD